MILHVTTLDTYIYILYINNGSFCKKKFRQQTDQYVYQIALLSKIFCLCLSLCEAVYRYFYIKLVIFSIRMLLIKIYSKTHQL